MTVYVVQDSIAYPLDDDTTGKLVAHDGFGMSPQHRLTERGPLQHGDTDRGFRLDPRLGTLILALRASNIDELYVRRAALLERFISYDDPFSLRWTYESGGNTEARQIDCTFAGDLTLPFDANDGYFSRLAVRVRAPDPTFYDPAGESVFFGVGGGGTGFVVPHEVPHTVGASVVDQTAIVTNDGDWLSFPHLIRITGPIQDCVITNETTGEKLDFDGVTIAAGDYYDIDLRYGYKTVVNAAGTNKIADLTNDSDLETWHLEPGENSLRVAGLAATEATQIEIAFYERYVGI